MTLLHSYLTISRSGHIIYSEPLEEVIPDPNRSVSEKGGATV